ncbi:MAG: nickel-binding protein [Chitinophagaceae bacterium]
MPIYMDRHDPFETVTAENILHMHQEDLKIQDQFRCKVLTYWFDEKRKNAFCLIEAPNAKAIQEMHHQAHGDVPNSIIEVDAGSVELFLGRIEDPEKSQNTELKVINKSALRVIMIIALKRFAPMPNDYEQFKCLLHDFNNAILNRLNVHEGNLVKQTESQFLVSFKSVSQAVHTALSIQLLFKDFRNNIIKDQIHFKIGLSAGLPVTEKKLIFEGTIKLAERMCKVIKGQVIVSSDVKELYNDENAETIVEGESISCLTPTDEKFLNLLMDYIESNWSNEHLKIDDFSKPLGCSKSQLYRKLISLTGKSPNTFIIEYRLNEAMRLLNKNAGNIAEIAFQTGFTSPSYFSKCFKKKYGHLPSDYLTVKVG